MYAKIVDNQIAKVPYSLAEMRTDNPGIVVSPHPSDEELSACSAKRVIIIPNFTDPKTTRLTPVLSMDANDNPVLEYISAPVDESTAASRVRDTRNLMIAKTDWVVTRSIERSEPVPSEYAVYRNALRDLPLQEGFPYNVVWPTLLYKR